MPAMKVGMAGIVPVIAAGNGMPVIEMSDRTTGNVVIVPGVVPVRVVTAIPESTVNLWAVESPLVSDVTIPVMCVRLAGPEQPCESHRQDGDRFHRSSLSMVPGLKVFLTNS